MKTFITILCVGVILYAIFILNVEAKNREAHIVDSGVANFTGASFTVNSPDSSPDSLVLVTPQNGVGCTWAVVNNKVNGHFDIEVHYPLNCSIGWAIIK